MMLGLFQEEFADRPWSLLVCVICLNQTSAKQLRPIYKHLFARWPDPISMALAVPDELEQMIAPLGLQRRRARALIRMSATYAFLWDGGDPIDLPGIGKYGSDSFKLFIRGELGIQVEDKELRRYLEWIKNPKELQR